MSFVSLNKRFLFKFLSLFSVVRGYNILFIITAQFISSIYILSDNHNFYEVVFDIPKGYKVSEIPKNAKYQHKLFGFYSEYEQKENQLILRFEFNNRYRFMKKENFKDWNEMLKILKSSYNETLILKKN